MSQNGYLILIVSSELCIRLGGVSGIRTHLSNISTKHSLWAEGSETCENTVLFWATLLPLLFLSMVNDTQTVSNNHSSNLVALIYQCVPTDSCSSWLKSEGNVGINIYILSIHTCSVQLSIHSSELFVSQLEAWVSYTYIRVWNIKEKQILIFKTQLSIKAIMIQKPEDKVKAKRHTWQVQSWRKQRA